MLFYFLRLFNMEKKTLFEANVVYTKEKMLQYSKSKFIIDWAYFWYFIVCLFGLLDLLSWKIVWWIMLLIIGFSCMLIWYVRRPKIEAQNFANTINEQFHTDEIKQEITFTDSSIKIKNLTSWANAEIFYNQIIRLIEKKWFYGLIFRYSNIFIDKDCFTEWNELEFKEFINQKINESKMDQKLNKKTNKKLNRAFRASIIFLIIFFGLIMYLSFLPEDTKDGFGQNYASRDLLYQTLSTEDSKIAEWYSIPVELLEKYPDVVSLILNSMSLSKSEEKQERFDMFYLMNDEQINQLRDILTREKEQLAEIEEKYNEEVSEINGDDNQENTWEVL